MPDALAGFQSLKDCHPYPPQRPDVPRNVHGWRVHLARLLPLIPEVPCVAVEVGSWCGKTALALLAARPELRMVCIDTWEGGPEHQPGRKHWQPFLPYLHALFLRNTWEVRDRVVPLRADSVDGIEECAKAGLRPALVYIDGGHDKVTVQNDVTTAGLGWPRAVICGDDWGNPHVEEGVRYAMELTGGTVDASGMFWRLTRPESPRCGCHPAWTAPPRVPCSSYDPAMKHRAGAPCGRCGHARGCHRTM